MAADRVARLRAGRYAVVRWIGPVAGRLGTTAGKRWRGSEADRPALMAVASMQAEGAMGSITIRTLDGSLKSRLRIQAAVHGRSLEEEARDILRWVLNQQPQGPRNLGTAIHDLFRPFGGYDMVEAPRDKMREPPRFD